MTTTATALLNLAAAIEVLAKTLDEGPTAPAAIVEPAPTAVAEPAPVVKLEDVRERLSELSRTGHAAQVRQLITDVGATKLSEVDPAQYGSLLAAAEQVAA